MSSYSANTNLHILCFASTTIGWILASACMGQANWRVWHLDNTTSIISGIAWVGIWKVCFYGTIWFSPPGRAPKICHSYGIYNTFLSHDFRTVQIILLCACILGAMGKVSVIIGLRNFHMGVARKSSACIPFTIGGFFYLSAGICVLICVIWNFQSVYKNQNINFPAAFYVPARPKSQEVGNAVTVAILSAILMLLGGVFFFTYKCHMNIQVHPLGTIKGWESSSEM